MKERRQAERRVALTPSGARVLVDQGHAVVIERGAGVGAGFADEEYAGAGAELAAEAAGVWDSSDLVVKVKELVEDEFRHLRPELVLFSYLHLAANRDLTQALVDSGSTGIAYETIEDAGGRLPLLAPMSEVAGRLAAQAGAYFLQSPLGGAGVLMGGVPGVQSARVVIIGGGVAGTHAARVAVGMGADVTILERAPARIRELEQLFDASARVLMSDTATIEELVLGADLVIGAVLVPGARAPRLLGRSLVTRMRTGAVIVDVAIDQGGCCETSRPTTHMEPTFTVDGVVHYCVTNMPGGVPVTATRALTNATLPYVERLAARPLEALIKQDAGVGRGLNVRRGRICHPEVADAHSLLAGAE